MQFWCPDDTRWYQRLCNAILTSGWYHYTYRCNDTRGCVMQFWPLDGIITPIGVMIYTYRCNDTRGCIMQFWPPDDEHMCSKHVEAWNKLIVIQKYCASSWLITEIKNLHNFFEIHWATVLRNCIYSYERFEFRINLYDDEFFIYSVEPHRRYVGPRMDSPYTEQQKQVRK